MQLLSLHLKRSLVVQVSAFVACLISGQLSIASQDVKSCSSLLVDSSPHQSIYQDFRFYFGILPEGTRFKKKQVLDATDSALWADSTEKGECGIFEALDVNGNIIAATKRFFSHSPLGIYPTDLISNYDSLVEAIHRERAEKTVFRVRFRHSHVLLPIVEGFFSLGDRRFSMQIKAFLEEDGFPNVEFEMQLIYMRLLSAPSKKSYIIPASSSWRRSGFSPGAATRRFLLRDASRVTPIE